MVVKLLARLAGTLALLALTGACEELAERSAPPKPRATVRSAAATRADELFWQTLHDGNYGAIGSALEAETAAYLGAPGDDLTAAHVGWLHIWRAGERRRVASVPATITDDIALARRYFEEAVALNPDDARYLGFLASATLAEGSLHHDERLTRRGYFMMQRAIKAWPEFNLFTAGYVMSGLPADSPGFREAVEWQWQNLDACAGGRVDRAQPDFARYLPLETHTGRRRACWNSAIAPHNFEGFFLNMGDMLVKAGDPRTARALYANARLSAGYAGWAYRDILEARIREADANVAAFRATGTSTSAPMMFGSPYACMACHQR
jgi:hypothetical protein